MANEITYTGSLTMVNGTKRATLSGSGRADMAGVEYVQKTQSIGTTEEALIQGDIAVIGWAAFRNTDPTNYVEIGVTTTVYNWKLLPGEFIGPVRIDGSTLFAKAHTGACVIEYLLCEA